MTDTIDISSLPVPSAGSSLKRASVSLIDRALHRIESPGGDCTEDVHFVRTTIKRLRAVKCILARLKKRSGKFRRASRPLGEKIFAEKPDRFIHRFKQHWRKKGGLEDKKSPAIGKRGGAGVSIRRQGQSMKPPAAKLPHKLGANQKETAIKRQKRDANFKQSRDIREDRGERQIKTGSAPRTFRGQ